MKKSNTQKIYKIADKTNHSYYYPNNYQKLNATISSNNKINIYFSNITRASNGGTLYFIDKRTCRKYYEQLKQSLPNCHAEIIIAKQHTRQTIFKIAPGLYISKNTTYYKHLQKRSKRS